MSLTEIVEVGRQKRAAQAARDQTVARAKANEASRLVAEQGARADALLSYSTLRSLSAAVLPAILLGMATVSLAVPLLFSFATRGGGTPAWVLLGLGAFAKLWAVLVLMVLRARRKDIEFREARPYRVSGYERSLDYGRSHPTTGFEIRFARGVPPESMLRDVLASIDEETKVERIEGQVAYCEVSGDGSEFDGHRHWMPRWFYGAAENVFDAIDAEYPIAEIRFPGY
jgi:hypothetical protein